ncbi:MAG: type II toxin-antitoxin system Phd/YefM family antitoxin [Acidobacteriia bacterium]|nr:type II toxin-antitoxin system Phd/YefM family antitoxin [Terriglobia bacterium]
MTNIISALTARTQLGQIIKRASQKDERFVVGRRGEPKVIIMGIRDYIKALAPAPQWLKAIRAEAKRQGLNQLTAREISREIKAVRKQGRAQAKQTSKAAAK